MAAALTRHEKPANPATGATSEEAGTSNRDDLLALNQESAFSGRVAAFAGQTSVPAERKDGRLGRFGAPRPAASRTPNGLPAACRSCAVDGKAQQTGRKAVHAAAVGFAGVGPYGPRGRRVAQSSVGAPPLSVRVRLVVV